MLRKLTSKVAPIVIGVITFLLLMLCSAAVYADDGSASEPNALTRVAYIAFQVLVPVLTAFAMYLANKLVTVFEKKTGIDISFKNEHFIHGWISDAIHLAEEWSYKQTKTKAAKFTGPEKIELAADFVLDMIDRYNLAGWTRDKVIKAIEARLGTLRANGVKPALDRPKLFKPAPAPLPSP